MDGSSSRWAGLITSLFYPRLPVVEVGTVPAPVLDALDDRVSAVAMVRANHESPATQCFAALSAEHVLVVPQKKVSIRPLRRYARDPQMRSMQRVVAPAVAVVFTQTYAHLQPQFRRHRDVAGIEPLSSADAGGVPLE